MAGARRHTLAHDPHKGWTLHHPNGHALAWGYHSKRDAEIDLRLYNDEQTPAERRAAERGLSRRFSRGA